MRRSRTHQINELAKLIFRDIIPETWVVNEQFDDYGIDFLVEISTDDGELTGVNFFVQLKGQESVRTIGPHGMIPYSLDSYHAHYYFEQIRDLPVFLVVVDVTKKCGWTLFLQRTLRNDQIWRRQDSRTLYLPSENSLSDTKRLEEHVLDAKEWMRRSFPDFHTPFLQQCSEYLFVEHDLPSAEIIDDGMIERMLVRWFPETSGGISIFDIDNNCWETGIEVDMLHINVHATGQIVVSPCDDDGCLVSVGLCNPEEIGEVMDLVESVTESCPKDQVNSIPLTQLIEPLMLLVPFHDQYVIAPPDILIEQAESVATILNAVYSEDTEGSDYLIEIGYPGWDQWCREHLRIPQSDHICFPSAKTCIYSKHTGVTTYSRWMAFGEHYRVCGVPIAFDLKECTSTMFLCDNFNETEAGREQIKRIVRNWMNKDLAESEVVEASRSKLEQIRTAFESRMQKGSHPSHN